MTGLRSEIEGLDRSPSPWGEGMGEWRLSLEAHLLLDVLQVRVEEVYEDGHGPGLDHYLRLRGRSRRYVGEGPSCLELERGGEEEREEEEGKGERGGEEGERDAEDQNITPALQSTSLVT